MLREALAGSMANLICSTRKINVADQALKAGLVAEGGKASE
jgi:hypothetical protein